MFRCALATFLAATSIVPPAFALERTAALLNEDQTWAGRASINVVYYNVCTGWVWVWSGWGPRDVFGVYVDSPVWAPSPFASWLSVSTGSPAGYGFTGTIELHAADANRCPTGASLAAQSFLPVAGWNGYLWDAALPPRFVVSVTLGPGGTVANPLGIDTDHPAAGPTGPAACGFCYPASREVHSAYYGTAWMPLCPGSPFYDDVCDAELLWEFGWSPVAVEQPSWGLVKSLYR